MPPDGGIVGGGVVNEMSRRAAEFIRELAEVRRLSAHTVDSYRRDLDILIAAGIGVAAEIKPGDIRRLLAAESKRNIKPASAARRLSAWRMFFDYLRGRGDIESNPARGVRAPKKPARLPRALTPDETAHFLDAPKSDSWAALRDAAMFELLYSAGLRVGELTALDLSDMDYAAGAAHVRSGKGGRGRIAPFGTAARDALQNWLPAREKTARCEAVFVNRRGARLSVRAVQYRAAARTAGRGCASRVSPHVLRHSCASHFLQSSGDLRATQDLLGHADIASTQIYTRLDFQNLARTYDRAHPRAKNKAGGA